MTPLTLEKIQFVKKTFCIDEEHKIENMNLEDAVIWAALEQAEKIALGELVLVPKKPVGEKTYRLRNGKKMKISVLTDVFQPQPPRED